MALAGAAFPAIVVCGWLGKRPGRGGYFVKRAKQKAGLVALLFLLFGRRPAAVGKAPQGGRQLVPPAMGGGGYTVWLALALPKPFGGALRHFQNGVGLYACLALAKLFQRGVAKRIATQYRRYPH